MTTPLHSQETEQFNVRMPSNLVKDLTLISKVKKVLPSDWIKLKLAEEVYQQKQVLLHDLLELSAKGDLTHSQLQSILGKELAGQVEHLVQGRKKR